MTNLDHIVVAASTLELGGQFIHDTLGIEVPDGGQHTMMGTHNKVMTLQNNVYLEIIAINPEMPAPAYPRWFGLDDPYVRHAITAQPRLLTWAVNTNNLDELLTGSEISLGAIKDAQRDNLRWRVAISEDGRLPGAGFMPLCIQWQTDDHPSNAMADLGCELIALTLYHPRKKWLQSALAAIAADDLVEVVQIQDSQPGFIVADIKGPNGQVQLSSAF